jgi:DNA-directed RNA polymerase subunit RPC12/RpoP
MLYDCSDCGSLYTSEQELEGHKCESVQPKTTTAKKDVTKSQRKSSNKSKSKASNSKNSLNTHTIRNTLTNKDSSADLTFHLSDSLSDIPTQIEIITSSADFGHMSNYPSIVTIVDGVQLPVNLLTSTEHDESASKDSIDLRKEQKLLSSASVSNLNDR